MVYYSSVFSHPVDYRDSRIRSELVKPLRQGLATYAIATTNEVYVNGPFMLRTYNYFSATMTLGIVPQRFPTMVVNGIVPFCMVLELVLIVIKNTSKFWEHYPMGTFIGGVDAVFTLVIPLYLFASVLWLLYFRSHYGFITKVRMMRMYQGGILSVVGAAMLWTAFDVGTFQKECHPSNESQYCEGYELRTAAGVMAIIDACLYCVRPTKSDIVPSQNIPTFPLDDPNVYVISNELPEYEEPPSYFDLKFEQSKLEPTAQQSPAEEQEK